MNAAAWFAGQSFHAGRPVPTPAPAPAPTADTRPRADYLLPSGEIVTLVRDHGEAPARSLTYQLADGRIVLAVLAPISRADLFALWAHAVGIDSASLKYLAEDALDLPRAGREPLSPEERHAAIRSCADQLEMLRAMGARIGGGA